METYENWKPVEGIVTPVARALIWNDHHGLVVRLIFSEVVGAGNSDLRIDFGPVPAYTVYEEFVHPWKYEVQPQKLIGKWEGDFYPLLLVKDSAWLDSISDLLFNYPDLIHYRFLTLSQIVDVLSNKQPEITWVLGAEAESSVEPLKYSL